MGFGIFILGFGFIWFLKFGYWNFVFVFYLDLGIWYLYFIIWFLEFGSWNFITWFLEFLHKSMTELPTCFNSGHYKGGIFPYDRN